MSIASAQVDPWGEDVYRLLTRVHRVPVFAGIAPLPFEAPALGEFVRRELDLDEGTPQWRAWLTAAAQRHGVLAVT